MPLYETNSSTPFLANGVRRNFSYAGDLIAFPRQSLTLVNAPRILAIYTTFV
jgi:hypothetical protein